MSFGEGVGIGGIGKDDVEEIFEDEDEEDIAKWWEIWYILDNPSIGDFFKNKLPKYLVYLLLAYVFIVIFKASRFIIQCGNESNKEICPNGIDFNDFYLHSEGPRSGHVESISLFEVDMIGVQPICWIFGIYLVRKALIFLSCGRYLFVERLFYFWTWWSYFKQAINEGKKKSLAHKKTISSRHKNDQRSKTIDSKVVSNRNGTRTARTVKPVSLESAISPAYQK